MDKEALESIAQRPTCCKTFGESVTISRAERDALVAMARDTVSYRELLYEVSEYLTCVIDGSMSRNNACALAAELQQQIDAAMAKDQP